MKKFYLLIVMIAFTGYLFGQQRVAGDIEKKMSAEPIEALSMNAKTPTDTIAPYGIKNADTLLVIEAKGGGYVTGVNSYGDYAKAQQFPVQDGYYVEGFLVWVGAKEIVQDSDSLRAVLYDLDGSNGTTTAGSGQTCPNSVLASVKMDMADVDTSGNFTPAMFKDSVICTDDYATGLDLTSLKDDTLGVIHSDTGDANASELAWEQWSDGNWYTFLADTSWQMDVDMAFLPVVDMSTQNINEQDFVNNIRMENYPNPASDIVNIDYQIKTDADVKIRVLDMSGKIVKKVDLGHKSSGQHKATISTENLESGMYLYMLESGNNRLAKRMMVK